VPDDLIYTIVRIREESTFENVLVSEGGGLSRTKTRNVLPYIRGSTSASIVLGSRTIL